MRIVINLLFESVIIITQGSVRCMILADLVLSHIDRLRPTEMVANDNFLPMSLRDSSSNIICQYGSLIQSLCIINLGYIYIVLKEWVKDHIIGMQPECNKKSPCMELKYFKNVYVAVHFICHNWNFAEWLYYSYLLLQSHALRTEKVGVF